MSATGRPRGGRNFYRSKVMLELKHLPVSSFNENIAYIHRDCPVYKIDNIKP